MVDMGQFHMTCWATMSAVTWHVRRQQLQHDLISIRQSQDHSVCTQTSSQDHALGEVGAVGTMQANLMETPKQFFRRKKKTKFHASTINQPVSLHAAR